jgi:hypothetical protein
MEKINAHRVSVGRPEGKRRPRRKWEENVETDLGEIGCGGMDWIHLAHDRDQWWAFVNTVTNLRVT